MISSNVTFMQEVVTDKCQWQESGCLLWGALPAIGFFIGWVFCCFKIAKGTADITVKNGTRGH
jgi:hypothetical protein